MDLAFAIPHAAHEPARKASLNRLVTALLGLPLEVFADREPHWSWSRKLWRWGLESGRDALVQLQDDVIVPAALPAILCAALTSAPKGWQVIALFGIHPLGRELARLGHRWHRTRAWLMGNGYVLSRPFLAEFVPWVEANEPKARVTCEDALINLFCCERGIDVYHPLPSLVEHDTSIRSSWADQAATMGLDRPDEHGHRKAVVSWRDYSPAELARASFWEQPQEPRMLADHIGPRCWFCGGAELAFVSSQETGVHLGPKCFAAIAQEAASRMISGAQR